MRVFLLRMVAAKNSRKRHEDAVARGDCERFGLRNDDLSPTSNIRFWGHRTICSKSYGKREHAGNARPSEGAIALDGDFGGRNRAHKPSDLIGFPA